MHVKVLSTQEVMSYPGFDELIEEYSQAFDSAHPGAVKVDWKAYEDFGAKLKAAAVIAEGKIVGIAAVLIQRSRHYDMPVVTIEALYLRRAYRKGTAGLRLLWAASDIARDSGAKGLALCAPPNSELERLCIAKGYADLRHVYWVPV